MHYYSSDEVSGFGAHEELQLLALLVSAAALLLLADPLRVPYPILLVLGGLILGFARVPNVILPPEVVLIGILPPLLYSAAFNTGLRDLKRNLRPISLLAIGLVTTVVVAAVAHYVIDLSWPAGFVLGAVVSPTDPLAAISIARRLEFLGARSRSSKARASSTTARRSSSTSSRSQRC